ncbi:TcdA/TcdB pore-forming domain-containing protein [Francisellaceae bacterium CB52]
MGNIISSNNKKIHTVWVGGPIPEIANSYLNIWAKLYTEDFKTITWVDSENLYVAVYNKVIKKYREYKLSKYLEENSDIEFKQYWEQAVNIEMTLRTDHEFPHETDDERKKTIYKIIDEKITGEAMDLNLAWELEQEIEKAVRDNEGFLLKVKSKEHKNKYGDVKKLLNKYDTDNECDFSSIYKKEINERGNLAAASDIIRLIALHQKNGLYIDMDLLPQIKKESFDSIFKIICREDPAITEKEIYYALELALGLEGSKTSKKDSGLNPSTINAIEEFINNTEFDKIFQKEDIQTGLAFKYVGGSLSNAEISSGAKSQDYLKRILDNVKTRYEFLKDLPDNFWNLSHAELEKEVDDLYLKYQDDIPGMGTTSISNYYEDSIIPTTEFPGTATLNLAGPTGIQGWLDKLKNLGVITESNPIKESNLSSLSTVEEQRSSWVVKEPRDYVFILKKLERFTSKSIKPNEKKIFFERFSQKIRSNINVNESEMSFIKELLSDNDFVKNIKYEGSIKLIKEKLGEFELSGDIVNLAWESPSKYTFRKISDENIVEHNTSNYDVNVIVQMQSDQIVNVSVLNLLNKNKETSVILQLSPNNSELNVFEWISDKGYFQSIPLDIWFNTKNGQSLRFQLVGHGNKDDSNEIRFGGMVVDQVKEQLNQIISKLNSENSIKNIKLDLIGCALMPEMKEDISSSFPGELTQWLYDKSKELNLKCENLSVAAREYPIKVLPNGRKEVFFKGKWINKDAANTYVKLNKSELIWDQDSEKVIKKSLSKKEILEISDKLYASLDTIHGLNKESQKIVVEIHNLVLKKIQDLLQIDERPSEHRTEVEKKIAESLSLIALGREWNDAVNDLISKNTTMQSEDGRHWHALIDTKEIEGKTHVVFVHESKDKESILIKTDDEIFSQFSKKYNKVQQDFNSHLSLNTKTGIIETKPHTTEGEAVHSLNAAFLLQALMDHRPNIGTPDNLSWPIKLQTYVGLVQPSIGVLEDGIHLGSMIASSLEIEIKPLSQALSAIKTAFPKFSAATGFLPGAISIIFDAANITGIIAEISKSKDPEETAVAATNLVMSSISAGVNIAGIIAGFTGAATATSILGMVALPLAGASIGITAIVQGIAANNKDANSLIKEFERVYNSVSNPTMLYDASNFEIKSSKDKNLLWSLGNGSVVTEIDFGENNIRYGEVTTIGTRGGGLHTFSGGLDHYLAGPVTDKTMHLDVYEAFGLKEKKKDIDLSYALNFYLPYGVNTHYSFNIHSLAGARYKNPASLSTLRSYYGQKFVWVYYALPTDYMINYLNSDYSQTEIQIKLDNKARNLFFPSIPDQRWRDKLIYKISGDGGQYLLKLPENKVKIEISPSQIKDEKWTLDVSSIKDINFDIDKKIKVKNSSLYLNDQKIDYKGTMPKSILLYSEIDDSSKWLLNGKIMCKSTLFINLDCVSNSKDVFLTVNSDQNRYLDYFNNDMHQEILEVVRNLNLNKPILMEFNCEKYKVSGIIDKDKLLYSFSPSDGTAVLFDPQSSHYNAYKSYTFGPEGADNSLNINSNGDFVYNIYDQDVTIQFKLAAHTIDFFLHPQKEILHPELAIYNTNTLSDVINIFNDINGICKEQLAQKYKCLLRHVKSLKEFVFSVICNNEKGDSSRFDLSFDKNNKIFLGDANWFASNGLVQFNYHYDSNTPNIVTLKSKNSPNEIKISHEDLVSDIFTKDLEFVFIADVCLKRLSLPSNKKYKRSFCLGLCGDKDKEFALEFDENLPEMSLSFDGKDLFISEKSTGTYTKVLNATDFENFKIKFKNQNTYMSLNDIEM